jgi:hypothetical protein
LPEWRWVGREIGRRSGVDVEGDAALAGTRLLRSASGGADRRRLRCFRGDDLQAVLRGEDGRAIDLLSKTRRRLPQEVHEEVFGWVLALIAEHGLVNGERIGVDASMMEANAALRTIVRRKTPETYREMLKRMAEESGIEAPWPTIVRIDRARRQEAV